MGCPLTGSRVGGHTNGYMEGSAWMCGWIDIWLMVMTGTGCYQLANQQDMRYVQQVKTFPAAKSKYLVAFAVSINIMLNPNFIDFLFRLSNICSYFVCLH